MKIVVRKNLPETNSSSSHSVSICQTKVIDTSELKQYIDKDNILHIPNRVDDFGWEWEKYNDIITKIQYTAILIKYEGYFKKIKYLKEIIRSVTGVKDVSFGWDEDYIERKKEDPSAIKDIPDIDHQSTELSYEILESRETIKEFIFNPGSWLFLGNDNSEAPEGFYDVDKDESKEESNDDITKCIIHFGENIGDIEYKINYPFDENNRLVSQLLFDGLLSSTVFDPIKNEYQTGITTYRKQKDEPENDKYHFLDIYINTNKLFLVFILDSVHRELNRYVSTVPEYVSSEGKIKLLLGNYNGIITESSYKLIEVEIINSKFGKLL